MLPSAIGGVGPGSPLASAVSATNTISRAHLISPFFARRPQTLHRDDRTRIPGQTVAIAGWEILAIARREIGGRDRRPGLRRAVAAAPLRGAGVATGVRPPRL